MLLVYRGDEEDQEVFGLGKETQTQSQSNSSVSVNGIDQNRKLFGLSTVTLINTVMLLQKDHRLPSRAPAEEIS